MLLLFLNNVLGLWLARRPTTTNSEDLETKVILLENVPALSKQPVKLAPDREIDVWTYNIADNLKKKKCRSNSWTSLDHKF